jgi:hypothetical protein
MPLKEMEVVMEDWREMKETEKRKKKWEVGENLSPSVNFEVTVSVLAFGGITT